MGPPGGQRQPLDGGTDTRPPNGDGDTEHPEGDTWGTHWHPIPAAPFPRGRVALPQPQGAGSCLRGEGAAPSPAAQCSIC